jgi:16S rRNA (guanine527-N7)-methyltransferase
MEPKIWFRNICKKNNLDISDAQLQLMEKFVLYLLEWNQKINLVSRRDEENIWQRHILASISFLFKFRFVSPASVVDVGTGGGLPGLPLAILHPDLKFILIDSIQKKIKATEEIVNKLQLKNVSVICSRAEQLASEKKFSGSMDYVLARAVAPTKDIVMWGKGFLKKGKQDDGQPAVLNSKKKALPTGSVLLLKGGDLTAELSEASLKLKVKEIITHTLVIDGIEQSELADKKLVVVIP